MSEPQLLSLHETGTRWEHYSELRELFACGIEILKNERFQSMIDKERLRKLTGAVELLDGRINLLADYTRQTVYGSKLRRVIDGDVDNIYIELKKENEDAAKAIAPKQADDSDDPTSYTTK